MGKSYTGTSNTSVLGYLVRDKADADAEVEEGMASHHRLLITNQHCQEPYRSPHCWGAQGFEMVGVYS